MNQKHITSCAFCQGTLKEQIITYTKDLNGKVVIVEQVPALVCAQCGERYYTPETLDRLHEAISTGKADATRTVPVYQLPR